MSDLIDRLKHCQENCGDQYLAELAYRAADRLAKLEDAATLFERLFNGGRLTGDEVARSTQLLEELKGE